MTEDEMVGWHNQLKGHEFEETQGVSDGQGSLVCCGPWGCRVGYNLATEQQQHDHCPVRLLPIFTVKADLRKKMEKKKKDTQVKLTCNSQVKRVLQKETLRS